ncbi:MAG: hypothetical protein EBE86_032930 [Hormoscilla sp. GUM202]|nr:hypothetical protein [Hormoscilla sp. GUM202]
MSRRSPIILSLDLGRSPSGCDRPGAGALGQEWLRHATRTERLILKKQFAPL